MTRALVTGGASGIGAAAARVLAARGSDVVVLDLAEAAGDGVPPTLRADVRDEAAVAAAVAEAGPVDLLVNAAGVYRVRALDALDGPGWDDVLAVNLRAPFLVAREARRAGRLRAVVNVSSIAALHGDTAEPAGDYAASKAGLLGLTRQMAAEWAPDVRVNAVCPGVIDTPMLRLMDDPAQGERYVRERVPLARLGTAEEVARVIAFLLSEEAAYVTGAALVVDGGVTAT